MLSKRYVCFQDAIRLILAERDKIPETVPGMGYEFHLPQPNHSGNLIRGGIRKALKVLETMPKADAVEVVRCKNCQKCFYDEEWKAYVARPGCPLDPIGFGYALIEPDGYCSRGVMEEVTNAE